MAPPVTVVGLLLGAVGKVILLHTVLFPILTSDSIAMVHVDPSIVINTPFAPLERLILFVGSSLALQLLLSTTTNTTTKIAAAYTVIVTYYTIVLYAIFILCGIAPTMETACHTFLAAFHVVVTSSLSAIGLFRPPQSSSSAAATTTTTSDVTSFWDTVKRVHAHLLGNLFGGSVETTNTLHRTTSSQQNQKQTQHRTTTSQQQHNIHQYYYYYYYSMYYGSIIGMIVASILRILDIGLQVQRHPIPIILGYTYGSIGGLLVWILITSFRNFYN